MMAEEKMICEDRVKCNMLLTGAKKYINTAKKFCNQNKYEEAINEYKKVAKIYMERDYYRELGICNRMIGEVYMWKADFDEAIKHQNVHLAIAREGNDLVEQQKATALLASSYLLQSQSFIDDEKSKKSLTEADKALSESYGLCEILRTTISSNDVIDMKVRLRINFALLEELLGNFDKAIRHLDEAIEASSRKKTMYELLLICYMTKSKLYEDKLKDYSEALECLNNAILVAQKVADKDTKIGEVLMAMATVCCKMSYYDRALAHLLVAGKLDSPDKKKIKTRINIVREMNEILQQLNSTNPEDYLTLKGYYEKLGDSACEILDFISGEKFYLYMFNCAEKAGLDGKELKPFYISVSYTYKELGSYDKAVHYLKEYALIEDDPRAACEAMTIIAYLLYLDKTPYAELEDYCNKARMAAQKLKNEKSKDYEVTVLKYLLKYQKKYGILNKMEDTKLQLRNLGCDYNTLDLAALDLDKKPKSFVWGNAVCIKDNMHAGILIGPSASYAVKRNGQGETQLHLACKSGKMDKVRKLISEGHPIDIRDNAGWLPLHEACFKGHTEIVKLLIDNGADVNDKGGKECGGTTPLIDAAQNGRLEVVEILLSNGAIPSIRSVKGLSPLEAVISWREKLIKLNKILLPDQEILYTNVCNKMNSLTSFQGNDLPQSSVKDITNEAHPGNRKVTKSKPLSINKRKMSDVSGYNTTKKTRRMSLDNNNGNSKDEAQFITSSSAVREPLKDLLGCNELFSCIRENDRILVIRKLPKDYSNNANSESRISDMDGEQQTCKDDDQQWNLPGPSYKPHITPPEVQNLVEIRTASSLPHTSPKPCANGGFDNMSAKLGSSKPTVRRKSKSERSGFLTNEADINSSVLQSEVPTEEHNNDVNNLSAQLGPSKPKVRRKSKSECSGLINNEADMNSPVLQSEETTKEHNDDVDNMSAQLGVSKPKVRRNSKSERSGFLNSEADTNSSVLQSEVPTKQHNNGPSKPKVRRNSKSERSGFINSEADTNSSVLQSEVPTKQHNNADCIGMGTHSAPSNHQSNEPSNSKQAEWTIIGYKIVDSLKGIENILDRIAKRYCS